jgi:hypothetical protein
VRSNGARLGEWGWNRSCIAGGASSWWAETAASIFLIHLFEFSLTSPSISKDPFSVDRFAHGWLDLLTIGSVKRDFKRSLAPLHELRDRGWDTIDTVLQARGNSAWANFLSMENLEKL